MFQIIDLFLNSFISAGRIDINRFKEEAAKFHGKSFSKLADVYISDHVEQHNILSHYENTKSNDRVNNHANDKGLHSTVPLFIIRIFWVHFFS